MGSRAKPEEGMRGRARDGKEQKANARNSAQKVQRRRMRIARRPRGRRSKRLAKRSKTNPMALITNATRGSRTIARRSDPSREPGVPECLGGGRSVDRVRREKAPHKLHKAVHALALLRRGTARQHRVEGHGNGAKNHGRAVALGLVDRKHAGRLVRDRLLRLRRRGVLGVTGDGASHVVLVRIDALGEKRQRQRPKHRLDAREHGCDRTAGEQHKSRVELREDASHRPHIDLRREGATEDDLRGAVRARLHVRVVRVAGEEAGPKVDQLHRALGTALEHDILRLDVRVHNPAAVHVGERAKQLLRDRA
eukprot:Opistho-1_new@82706